MTTRTSIESTTPAPGTGVNLSDDAAAQEAVAAAGLRSIPGGKPQSNLLAKVKNFGESEVRLKHVGAVAGAALVVVGYEYLAAKKDWGFRLGVFKGKKK